MVRAIIFDFDDTLVRTKEISFEKHSEVGEHFGYGLKEEDFRRHYGKAWPEMISIIFPGLAFKDFYERLMLMEKDFAFKEVDGAAATLRLLRGTGFTLGILSGDFRDSFIRRASRLGHLECFDDKLIFCADDVAHPKPDGRAFQPVLESLASIGIAKEEAVFVGDLLIDYLAARGAGVDFFAVMTGFQKASDFLDAGLPVGRILSSVAELPSRLGIGEVLP